MPLVLAPGFIVVRPLSRADRAELASVPPTLIPRVAGGAAHSSSLLDRTNQSRD